MCHFWHGVKDVTCRPTLLLLRGEDDLLGLSRLRHLLNLLDMLNLLLLLLLLLSSLQGRLLLRVETLHRLRLQQLVLPKLSRSNGHDRGAQRCHVTTAMQH